MKFGKRIIFVNSLIIAILAAVIAVAAAVAGGTVLRNNIRDALIDTVSSRAALIAEAQGVIPDDFDYNVGGVYLSVYLSDGTLKNGSLPGEVELPIRKGLVSSVRVDGGEYYVYDFAVPLEGREAIYLRGMVAASYDTWYIAASSVTVFAAALAAAGIILNILSVRRAVRPIDRMRNEVNEITLSGDVTKRLSAITEDSELALLADDYNRLLDSLTATLNNHERFTSDVAHELRTPLTVILSESEYALRDTEDTAEKDASLAVILRQSKRLKAITDSLLEFTRFVNKINIPLQPADISSLTEEFTADYPFPAGISCRTEIEAGIVVSADATLYERILQNLIENAVKYGKEGGHVRVALEKREGQAILTVADDGIGMSEEAVKHAFDRFYRAEAARSDKGLGLGLCFVKEIVRLFGGHVEIASVLGEGTCVTVILHISD